MDIHRLKQKTAAELLGVTARTLRDWSDAPRNTDGTYDGTVLVRWLVAREAGVELDPVRERARKDKELADKYAAENAVRRGELLPISEAESAWAGFVMNARARLLRLPTDCAALVGSTHGSTVHDAVKRGVHDALRTLADYQPEDTGHA